MVRITRSGREPAGSLFREYSLRVAASVNDAKNSYLGRLYAIEDHIIVDGESADVGAQVRFEALAEVRELGK